MTKPDNISKNHAVTIYDVARESGVSYSTVSRVLNGFEHVRASTREKVLQAAEKLGYVANLQARSLAGGRTQIVGILVPVIDNSYITEIIAGIDDELARANYNMMLFTTHRHVGKEKQYVNTIANGMSDGVLLLVPLGAEAYLDALREREFPYVLIDQEDTTGSGYEVMSTNWQGAYEATEYLVKLGHRRIGFISGLEELQSTHERLGGFKAALQGNGVPIVEDYIVAGDFWEKEAYRAMNVLLSRDPYPTAVFASNDLTAFGAMAAIRDAGLAVPEDISIIGFDDVPQASLSYPKLTTIRQPLEQMGRVAVKLLMSQLTGPDETQKRITLATQLVVRDSCRLVQPEADTE